MTAIKAGAPSKNVDNSYKAFVYQIQVRIEKFIQKQHDTNKMIL